MNTSQRAPVRPQLSLVWYFSDRYHLIRLLNSHTKLLVWDSWVLTSLNH